MLTRNHGQGPLEPTRHRTANLHGLMSQHLISPDLLQAVLHCYVDTSIVVKQRTCPCQKMQQAAKFALKQDKFMHTAAFILTSVKAPTRKSTLTSAFLLMIRAAHHLQGNAAKRRAASSAMRKIMLAITTQQPPLPKPFSQTQFANYRKYRKKLWQKFLKI